MLCKTLFRGHQALAIAAMAACAGAQAGAPATVHERQVDVVMVGPGYATDLSADGTTVVGNRNGNYEIFRWTAETGMVGLGRNPYKKTQGRISGAPAVSADGKVVAGNIISSVRNFATEGRWTADTGWVELDHPLPRGGGVMDKEDSSVNGMSRDGKVVTGLFWRPHRTGGSAWGSVWSEETGMQGLATAGGSARIDDANGDGSVLAGWEESPTTGQRQATIWQGGAKTTIDAQDWGSEAEKLNTAGDIVVGQAHNPVSDQVEATLWRRDGDVWAPTYLGRMPGSTTGYSYANAVSDDGSVVGGMNRAKWNVFDTKAFLWTPDSGMVGLEGWLTSQGVNLSRKYTLSNVMGISADGMTILAIGSDRNPPYTLHSFLIKRRPPVAAAH